MLTLSPSFLTTFQSGFGRVKVSPLMVKVPGAVGASGVATANRLLGLPGRRPACPEVLDLLLGGGV